MDPLTLVMLAVLAMLIFFMWRNSKKRKEEMTKLQDSMVPGAEVMTNFGLFGTLLSIDEEKNIAVIETSPGNAVKVHRQTLARVVDETEGSTEDEVEAEAERGVIADADATPEAPGTTAKND